MFILSTMTSSKTCSIYRKMLHNALRLHRVPPQTLQDTGNVPIIINWKGISRSPVVLDLTFADGTPIFDFLPGDTLKIIPGNRWDKLLCACMLK